MRIAIAGTGNLAWHLCRIFVSAGHSVAEVYGRPSQHLDEMAMMTGARVVSSPAEFSHDLDAILIAVNDDAISEIASNCPEGPLLIHTSGTKPIESLGQMRSAVSWPVQSFIRGREMSYEGIPVFVETMSMKDADVVAGLWHGTGLKVISSTGEERMRMHMAAVFASNFPNHLFVIAKQLALDAGQPFDVLKPLIFSAIEKLQTLEPEKAQTGPAIRGDKQTIQLHLSLLSENEHIQIIYKTLSESIQRSRYEEL